MAWNHLLLDLDNTLYPKEAGLLAQIDQRIDDYLAKRLQMETEAVRKVRTDYYLQYGTTLRGVKENHGVDPLEYFDHAYKINIPDFISPDPKLKQMLLGIPAQKHVFSNSPAAYIQRVLDALDISSCITQTFDLTFTDYRGKPDPEAYHMVLKALGVQGEECMMVEDYAINLLPAKELGMTTVWIGDEKKPDYVDIRLDSIDELITVWS